MLRKTILILISLPLLYAFSETEICPIKNDNGFTFGNISNGYWHSNTGLMKQYPGGKISREPGGRTNTCMKFSKPAEGLCSVYSRAQIPLLTKTEILNLAVWVKGTGKFSLELYAYGAKGRFITGKVLQTFSVNHTEWTEKKTSFSLEGQIPPEVSKVCIVLASHPGQKAELFFDDFSGHMARNRNNGESR